MYQIYFTLSMLDDEYMASIYWIIIGSSIGLVPAQRQAITRTNVD